MNNKYLIFAMAFALLNMGAISLIFGFGTHGDSVDYINAVHWFQGQETSIHPWIALRPLGPIFALPFEFLGKGAGLIVQNMIFYLFSAFLIFKIADLIFQNKKQALLASLFFVTATPILEVGLAYLIDMGAWFFYILSIFLTLLYLKNKNEKLVVLNGFLTGLGFLMKENGALGVLFFGLVILLSKEFNSKEKVYKLLRFGIFFLIPVILLQVFAYRYAQVTSLDLYLYQLKGFGDVETPTIIFLRYFGQLFRSLGVLWIFFFIGLRQELKEKNWDRLKVYLALLPASLSFFLWQTSAAGRSVFVFAPLGILLATYGCRKMGYLPLTLIFLIILVLNYAFVWFNSAIPFIDTLAGWAGII